MVQWLRIHLPVQGTEIWSLLWEDSTCRRVTKPMSHNYWAQELQLLSPHAATTEAQAPWSPCSATREAITIRSPCTTTRESPYVATKTQASQKIKYKRKKKKKILDSLSQPVNSVNWSSRVNQTIRIAPSLVGPKDLGFSNLRTPTISGPAWEGMPWDKATLCSWGHLRRSDS